ncbi:hypothetical protein GCM10010909_08970 [Acidocella aquatica]|uniref:Glycosyl transferase family 8 n=1 Tax=Acidocella aquatica TaxID=1922313 RepID=A0ABQ6A6Q1_9PROT|nr:glycosyltransferase [Acidocella aquatica]GLR66217.1 hypothetical protein GCM10010909_08970 [Acidocella aquatica]
MRWYFAIDEAGGLGETGALARLMVLSARAIGGLEPVLLYYGARTGFTAWMEQHGVRVRDIQPRFLDMFAQARAAGTFNPHSIGHWLRLEIPAVEHEHEFVLYTDCDIIFLRSFDLSMLRPKVFAAAPEMLPDNWNYFNSGVMLLNVPAMRATYPALEEQIKFRINSGDMVRYNDQFALNEAYRGLWERLDPLFNYKPYWPFTSHAAILHMHGPKPGNLEAMTSGQWHGEDQTSVFFSKMLNARSRDYLDWCSWLGDFLQGVDFSEAIRFARLASALIRYRREVPANTDSNFMNIKIFAEAP